MNFNILVENSTNGFEEIVLTIISFISIFFGILVIITKNPIISVLYLISLFLSVSFYLMFLGLNFIGISYLLVYIGAVSILFLFILMLINVRVSELLADSYNSILLSVIIALSFSVNIGYIIPYNISGSNYVYFNDNNINNKDLLNTDIVNNSDNIYVISSESWDSNLIENFYITSIGNVLYTNYCIWLILASIILLLAMVGCIIITIKQQ